MNSNNQEKISLKIEIKKMPTIKFTPKKTINIKNILSYNKKTNAIKKSRKQRKY